ncbi:MAG: DUF4064 domain-containing protein [Bacillota bacterium]
MRKASRVLGIVGGSLCLGTALLLGLLLLFVASIPGEFFEYYDDTLQSMSYTREMSAYAAIDPEVEIVFNTLLPALISLVVAGALGITAGVLVYKKNIAAGVMFIVAAGAGYFNFICMVCLILAAIFAFVKPKPKPAYYPYYPYPPYPYYPPQGQVPQPPYGQPMYGQMPYGQPYYGQPPYAQPYYGQPPYPPQPPYSPQPQPAGSAPQEAPKAEPAETETQGNGADQPQS